MVNPYYIKVKILKEPNWVKKKVGEEILVRWKRGCEKSYADYDAMEIIAFLNKKEEIISTQENQEEKITDTPDGVSERKEEIIFPEQTKDFNFLLVAGDDGKKPIEKSWQKKTHRMDCPI